jgi:Peptidase family M49
MPCDLRFDDGLISVKKNGPRNFTLLVASAQSQRQEIHEIKTESSDITLIVEYGDFAKPLQKAVAALQKVTAVMLFSNANMANLLLGKGICCKR